MNRQEAILRIMKIIGNNSERVTLYGKYNYNVSNDQWKKISSEIVDILSIHDVTKRNWFEKFPLHIKLLLHTGVGVLLGLTIAYVW
jgi:hypothetical protein